MSDNKDAMLEYSRFISQKSLGFRCNDRGLFLPSMNCYTWRLRSDSRTHRPRPEIFRALALALGFTLPFLTDSCLLGLSEKTSYVGWIKRLGTTCICRSPLPLTTDPMERKQLRSQLAGDMYRGRRMLFVLSI